MLLLLALGCSTPDRDSGTTAPLGADTSVPHDSVPHDSVPTDSTGTEPPSDEVCDGVDNDGDGSVDEDVDQDGDGFEGCAADCDDTDAAVNPAATEVDNGVDDDCDVLVDEGAWAAGDLVITEILADPLHTLDRDGEWVEVHNPTAREVSLAGLVFTAGAEIATVGTDAGIVAPGGYAVVAASADPLLNGGVVATGWSGIHLENAGGELSVSADSVLLDTVTWDPATPGVSRALEAGFEDAARNDDPAAWCDAGVPWADGDLGSPGAANPPCPGVDRDGDGISITDGDCDETDPAVYPGAPDTPYDGVITDCDASDEYDVDHDGYDAIVSGGLDCDDTDAAVAPGRPEVCGGADEDCDGLVDDDDPDVTGRGLSYGDADGDGYGEDRTGRPACAAPERRVMVGGDCEDRDAAVNPGMVEVCGNGVDDDCVPGEAACGLSDTGSAEVDAYAAYGNTTSAYLGSTLADLGDVTGDGLADLGVGAPGYTGTFSSAGAVFVLGPLHEGGAPVATLLGEATSDGFGTALRGAGDVDGDGVGDVLVGAPAAEVVAGSEGVTWLFLGPVLGALIPGDAALYLHGAAGSDQAGSAVAAGDVDGDGTRELLVGAITNDTGGADAGAVYVVDWAGEAGLSLADAGCTLTGERAGDDAGRTLAVLDWDGDGIDEVAIGSTAADIGGSNAGAVWIADASGSGTTSLRDAAVVFDGGEANAGAASDLATGLDADGDGRDDLLVGAPLGTGTSASTGVAYLVSAGTASGSLRTVAAARLQVAGGRADATGAAVAFAGDVDGDGAGDALLGATQADSTLTNVGALRLYRGPLAGVMTESATLFGSATSDGLGQDVTGVADQDGDGDDELAAGAPYQDGEAASGGAAYWLLGGPGI
jgi:hypothetical protein